MEVGLNHQQLALAVFICMYTYVCTNVAIITDELSATNQCTRSTLHCAHVSTVDMCMVKA